MRARVPLLAVALASGLVLGQEDEGPRAFHIDLDGPNLATEVERARKLLESGSPEDGLALVERLLRDPRIHEGFVETRTGVLSSLDHVLRARLRSLPEAAQRAYDARWDEEAERLEELGTRRSLERLLALYPGSSRAPRCKLRLALLELEAGDAATAASRLEELGGEAQARVALPAAYALIGRRRACGESLARLDGDEETLARRLAARAARERETAGEPAPQAAELESVAWTFETPDFYTPDPNGTAPALAEPSCDAGTVYVQDQSRCVALELETGKLLWRTPLVPGADYFMPLVGPCRVSVGASVVACPLPSGSLVTLDRRTGERLTTITLDQLRALAGGIENGMFVMDATVAAETLVAVVLAQEVTQEALVLGFDARSGSLLWKISLGRAPFEIGHAPLPLVARGAGLVFVAPAWGVLAAIDPMTGEVAWIRRYATQRAQAPLRPVHRGRRAFNGIETPFMRAGFLGLVRGRLLLAAPDSKEMAAFDPHSGEPIFATEDDGAPVVAVHGGRLVEVSKDGNEIVEVGLWKVSKAKIPRIGTTFPGVVVDDVLLLPPAQGGLYRVPLGRARDVDDELSSSDQPERAPRKINLARPSHLAAWEGGVVATDDRVTTIRLGDPGPPAAADGLDAASASRALGDARFVVRQRAAEALDALGTAARAELDLAALSHDPERAWRARCLRDRLLRAEREARFKEAIAGAKTRVLSTSASLVSPNHSTRLSAVLNLMRSPDTAFRPILEELVSDPHPDVALKAAQGAFELGGRTGVPLIVKQLGSPIISQRRIAMESFVRHGGVEDSDIFVRGLADEDSEVRNQALDGALTHGDARTVPAVVKALSQGEENFRLATLQKLSVMRVDAAVAAPILRHFLRDKSAGVRHRTALVLGRTSGPEARTGLVEALDDPSPDVRHAAAEGLRTCIELEDPPDLPPGAMEKMLEWPDRALLVRAARMLEHRKVVRPASLASVALSAPADVVKVDALVVLRRSVDLAPLDSRDVAAIGSLTRVAAVTVRRSALETLVVAHGAGRGTLLARMLEDEDHEVRTTAAERLPNAGAEAVLELLALDSAPVAKVLEACDARVLAVASLRALDSSDSKLRSRGLARLRELRPALEPLARDEKDPELAAKLREALERSRP